MLVKDRDLKFLEITTFEMPVFEELEVGQDSSTVEVEEDVLKEEEETKIIILDNSDQNIALKEREAYEKGFEVGEKAGFELGMNKAKIIIDGIEKIQKSLLDLKKSVINDIEPKIISLAMEIAKKIIITEISTKPEVMLNIVIEAIRKIEIIDKVTIKINPALYEVFVKHKSNLVTTGMDLYFDVDPSVPVYGPIVIGSKEEIVTDIEEQLKIISQCIENALTTD